jgi:AhpC/TSA family
MKKSFLALYCFILYSCQSPQDKYISSIYTVPSFDILKMDSTTVVHAEEMPCGKSVVIVYFRPDCPHCQKETKNLLGNIDKLANIQIYFLSGAPLSAVKDYCNHYQLDKYSNITIGTDYNHSFAHIYKPGSVPFTAIYNQRKKLVGIYKGEITTTEILIAVNG